MKLQKTFKRGMGEGSGWVLFGSRPDTGKWLERWFSTPEAAKAFAAKRGWEVEEK